jgi:transposase
MDDITYVGLDVHKATVRVAVAESGRGGEVRQIGVFENRPEILRKMVVRLGKEGRRLSFCYEAGPCGYGLHRLLIGCGHSGIVVAPSLIPMKSGDRVKTDRRDAMMLAKLHRAGELTAIWIPDAAHEGCATWCGRERRQGECSPRRGSICKAFCFAMTGPTVGLVPGPRQPERGGHGARTKFGSCNGARSTKPTPCS